MVFSHPWLLWLLPLAILPLLLQRTHAKHYSWVNMLPADPLSDLVGLLLKALALLTLLFIIIGLSAPHTKEQSVERIGVGAQIALVLDRSASMDDPFSGSTDATGNTTVGETKSVAAARLITEFVKSRQQDMFGMITFSNSAMYVLPLSENKKAIISAVQATSGNALFQTNIGSGLTSSAGLFNKIPDSGSRAVILVSDGAGRMDANTQQKIKDWFDRLHLSLYWIVLRQPDGLSIFDTTYKPVEDQPLPAEIELYEFFKTLKTPFKAYEAEDPKSLQLAMNDINNREKKPIKYFEKIPGRDYSNVCFIIAAIMISLLLSVKYLEVKTWH
ncbi:MAG: vWA domain-containing protein [Methylotenera sp.]|nr:vWA domain-containing protein [Methylotenera sp.]MDO9232260.1 vWA domain-containing protein [Methylotenera sp.]MDO9388084.1 vWA domain-containing protein [Methylotenera sp.]MDP2102210.1 vWA domain-containing protein [Methylotenera sp.]MDP2281170.1 vWA domain-containing protein [Methylotenera sp.]